MSNGASNNSVISKPSQLFTLRLWMEQGEEGHDEWRGRLHCVATDEVRYFRDWPSLLPLLLAMLRDADVKITVASPGAVSE